MEYVDNISNNLGVVGKLEITISTYPYPYSYCIIKPYIKPAPLISFPMEWYSNVKYPKIMATHYEY